MKTRTRTRGPRTAPSIQFDPVTKATYRIDRSNLRGEIRDVGKRGVELARAALETSARAENLGADLHQGSTFEQKVRRLLDSGRVTIQRRDEVQVIARVVGDHGEYVVVCDERGRWSCSCPVWGERCTHCAAVRKVVGLDVTPR